MEFHHDRFSSPGPEWISTSYDDKDILGDLVRVAEDKFSSFIGKVIKVHKAKGLEINSSNFMIQGSSRSMVIKLLDIKNSFNLKNQIKIYEHINNLRLPGPLFIGSDNGKLLGRPFLAIEYIPGQYFSGSNRDLYHAGFAIQELHTGFKNCSELLLPESPILQSNPNEILTEFIDNKNLWNSKFDSNLLSIIQKNIDLITETESKCSANLPMLLNEEKSNFHIDLHPHNIIIGTNRATIIDIDSFKKVEWPSAIGFCFFKLSRQAIAFQGTKNISYSNLRCFFETISSRHVENKHRISLCFFGGLTEILRRILIILEGNLGYEISPWNQVLEIQIKAISEIYFLYDKVFGY